MSEQTPGPWEFLPFDGRIVHQRCDHGAQEIAWSDADYRLIAAAPELLAALKTLMAEPEEQHAHNTAFAAIAKAEGKAE